MVAGPTILRPAAIKAVNESVGGDAGAVECFDIVSGQNLSLALYFYGLLPCISPLLPVKQLNRPVREGASVQAPASQPAATQPEYTYEYMYVTLAIVRARTASQ